MPPLIWIALALAIIFIGASAGINMPRMDEIVKPVADNTGIVLKPVAYCIGIAIIIVAGAFAIGGRRGGQ